MEKTIAQSIISTVTEQVKLRQQDRKTCPQLDVILVGDDPASHVYVRHKQRACDNIGIHSRCHTLPASTSAEHLHTLIEQLNSNNAVNGILLQLPLPQAIDSRPLLSLIDPNKDVDGFHPFNFGCLALRQPRLRCCTPYGIIHLLEHTAVNLKGQHAVVVGASNIVGRPMALELLLKGCTVTVCHRFTTHLESMVQQADILVSAIGKPGIIQSEWIKPQAIVIDVGIHRNSEGRLHGDIEFATAKERASWITPVPGGVGTDDRSHAHAQHTSSHAAPRIITLHVVPYRMWKIEQNGFQSESDRTLIEAILTIKKTLKDEFNDIRWVYGY